jgi:flagellar basal-body rod protein FlgC
MDDMFTTMRIAASGMKSQGTRLRTIAENIANADTLPTAPGEEPYRRRVVTFRQTLDRSLDTEVVEVGRVKTDPTPFPKTFDPGHPGADGDGYVLRPNVNALIEMTDMREAQRSYEANLNVIKTTRGMLQDTLDVLR